MAVFGYFNVSTYSHTFDSNSWLIKDIMMIISLCEMIFWQILLFIIVKKKAIT